LTPVSLGVKIHDIGGIVQPERENQMTHDEIMDALLALLDAVLHNEPTPALMLEKAREALRLLNQVGFQ
jgi:hypothetical protein